MGLSSIVIRSHRGLASTLEALAVVGHFQGLHGPKVFASFRAPRDPFTNKHYGYIVAEADSQVVDEILEQPEQFVKVSLPCSATEIQRHRTSLAEVLATMGPFSQDSQPSRPETDSEHAKVLQLTIEAATERPMQRRTRSAEAGDRLRYPPPSPNMLEDLLLGFDGFADPGRLRRGWQRRLMEKQMREGEQLNSET